MATSAKFTKSPARVLVVGSGALFVSGISYYTSALSSALASRSIVRVILMRRLLPRWLYPGKSRVGERIVEFEYGKDVEVFDGVDWNSPASLFRAVRFLRRAQPDIVVFQWWTATVLHSYLLLAFVAKSSGARIVIEFHESLDFGELRIAPVRWYVRALFPVLMSQSSAVVIHSEFDKTLMSRSYEIVGKEISIIPHGPYDQYREDDPRPTSAESTDVVHLLYFGVIRPFKGVEDLVRAFDLLSISEAAGFKLSIVGEVWENWELPIGLARASRHSARINVVPRYVSDAEAGQFFREASVVVLPYRRSSSSGPLQIAMAQGLPVIVTAVGGLVEAVASYDGAVLVEPGDPAGLVEALRSIRKLVGRRYETPTSWEAVAERYGQLFDRLVPPSTASIL